VSPEEAAARLVILGTELLPTDPLQLRRQKVARITLDSMVQFVGLLDAEGSVLEINKVALDAVGITLADVQGKPFWTTFWWQVSEAVNLELRTSIARAAAGEFVRWDAEIYGRAGGKETIIIDASLMPVRDETGKVVFICAEGRDITEKKAQERLIERQNAELSGLLRRIRELDEIKTQFFANVSHELRTPLALILGPAQRLIEDNGALTLAQRREGGLVIARNARMLLKHVNDLLDMSKIEARKLTIELVETDVAAVLRLLASHFSVLAADRGIELQVEADSACRAAVDPDKLQRILMNLLGNAFKFVPNGGRVRCSLLGSALELRFVVEDSGPGVKPELRPVIFERFRQGDGGINRAVGGTGLGLAIAKEFVELHRGRIEVLDSELGGARFQVVLPRSSVEGAQQAASDERSPQRTELKQTALNEAMLEGVLEELRVNDRPASSAEPAELGRARVLVVEDNPDMNRFITETLSAHYDVVSAFDGREGLEKASRYRPVLILTDIMMPHVSGVEMIAQLRGLPEQQHVPILLLSAKADEELMTRLLEEGARDFIVKPFSEKDVLVRVRNLITAEQTRQQIDGLRVKAESANRAKDEFLAMLGHELRNPLSPILTALQLMKLRGNAGSERERLVIERQVNHLTRLVEDLLDVSRIARGRVELKTELLEFSELVARAIEMSSPLLEQRMHRLQVDMPRHGLPVEGDPTRLSQVVSNLLTNAAKYTPPGGQITIRADRVEMQVVLSVRDNGVGIPRDMLPCIFDAFTQAPQSQERAQGGLGLGLSIVRSLVERHGGSVSAHSDGPDKGSEFVVHLPLAERGMGVASPTSSPLGEPVAPHSPAPALSRFERILVVDDNEDNAEMLAQALSQKGYETRVAHDAPSALRVAATFAPDIAFLDIGLPVMDGYELAVHLRDLPGLAQIQLIALTGYGRQEDRQKSQAAGFQQHLVKPVDMAAIDAVLSASTTVRSSKGVH